MGFVNRECNAAIYMRRCVALKTRPEEMKRSSFMGRPLSLQVSKERMKRMAGGRSKRLWCVYQLVFIHPRVAKSFRATARCVFVAFHYPARTVAGFFCDCFLVPLSPSPGFKYADLSCPFSFMVSSRRMLMVAYGFGFGCFPLSLTHVTHMRSELFCIASHFHIR